MEQKEAFEEAINAHATMGKAVMEATTTQCGEIQHELMELRSATKKELSSLQGVLEVILEYYSCCFVIHSARKKDRVE